MGRVAYMNIFYYFQSHTCGHFIWLNCMIFNHVYNCVMKDCLFANSIDNAIAVESDILAANTKLLYTIFVCLGHQNTAVKFVIFTV